jgi:hypothetical protein
MDWESLRFGDVLREDFASSSLLGLRGMNEALATILPMTDPILCAVEMSRGCSGLLSSR